MSTYTAKPSDITKKWMLIDATDLVVGRLASIVAMHLRGKHLPTYTPNMDMGDNVIIINAEKVKLTGNKLDQRKFFWHTGYPGRHQGPDAAPAARRPLPRARARERRSPHDPVAARSAASRCAIFASMPATSTRTKPRRR